MNHDEVSQIATEHCPAMLKEFQTNVAVFLSNTYVINFNKHFNLQNQIFWNLNVQHIHYEMKFFAADHHFIITIQYLIRIT